MKKYSIKSISHNDIWQSENIYHLKTDISRISKLIYHYEIFKKISGIPGDIVEMGVFKGISLIRFATYRAILENNFSRTIYGFDDFGKFTPQKDKDDKNFIKMWTNAAGYGISKKELEEILNEKKFDNIKLIEGDISKTLPKFIRENKHLRISLLHLDFDVYKPTKFALEKLFDKVVKGGLILIDDFAGVAGASRAVDEFLSKNRKLKIEKLSFYRQPSFIIKN